MNALRPFARPVVLLWLGAFALFMAAPMDAFAKREMTIGNGSLEGDPGDSMDAIGGGGGTVGGADTINGAIVLDAPHIANYAKPPIGLLMPVFIGNGIVVLPFYFIFKGSPEDCGGGRR
ncbi:MAG: hypothetical protein IH621_15615 [Krumholzibacteria bacterium]|nr:hypothetical protein [Candidatus Krumholzibacteria bacterium]